ncbi:MAG TPA: NAD-dependent epimerase/dehydratase family protein [Vicinamibacterales bacterium]|nr:NAD-dependent epimerase/dehydratase family protein [Vicinamibacterales bacterium]
MNRTYLVTGGTGFIGSALVRRLVADGHRVRVFDDNSRGRTDRLAPVDGRFEFHPGDIRDLDAVKRAVRGVDAVCHLAFINGTEFFYTRPELVLDVAVKGMSNVLDACIDAGVRELLLTSSSEVYQSPAVIPTDETVPLVIPDVFNPRYSYAAGKLINEVMAINYGRKHFDRVVIVRPHNVYGPDMGWEHVVPQLVLRMHALAASTEEPVPFPIQGDGTQSRSFIYIDDFTDGLMLAMERGDHLSIYHVGTMDELTIADVSRAVGAYFGRTIRIVPASLPAGGTNRRCPDTAKISRLGFHPKFSFRDGLALTAAWYVAHADRAPQERSLPA